MRTRQILIALALKHDNAWEKIYDDITNRVTPTSEELKRAEGVEAITIVDENYPRELKQVLKPPFVIFGDKVPTFRVEIVTTFRKVIDIQADSELRAKLIATTYDGTDTSDFDTKINVSKIGD